MEKFISNVAQTVGMHVVAVVSNNRSPCDLRSYSYAIRSPPYASATQDVTSVIFDSAVPCYCVYVLSKRFAELVDNVRRRRLTG